MLQKQHERFRGQSHGMLFNPPFLSREVPILVYVSSASAIDFQRRIKVEAGRKRWKSFVLRHTASETGDPISVWIGSGV